MMGGAGLPNLAEIVGRPLPDAGMSPGTVSVRVSRRMPANAAAGIEVIAIIKAAATPSAAKGELMARTWRSTLVEGMLARATAEQFRPEALPKEFGLSPEGYRLSEMQAQRILEMQLQRLTGLEQDKIVSEYREVIAAIEDLLDILAKPERVTRIRTRPWMASLSSTIRMFRDGTRGF